MLFLSQSSQIWYSIVQNTTAVSVEKKILFTRKTNKPEKMLMCSDYLSTVTLHKMVQRERLLGKSRVAFTKCFLMIFKKNVSNFSRAI